MSTFFEEKMSRIFTEKHDILDIGGGLRLTKSNIISKDNEWLLPYISKVNYLVLDKEDTYNPDIVGDIHKLPFEDETWDAIICNAVLQHVENPQEAMQEIYRVLKPNGFLYFYVPFLYYTIPLKGYYSDYWRFTEDGIKHLTKHFSQVELEPVRGPIETIANLIYPKKLSKLWNLLDRIFYPKSKQVSGYQVFCIK